MAVLPVFDRPASAPTIPLIPPHVRAYTLSDVSLLSLLAAGDQVDDHVDGGHVKTRPLSVMWISNAPMNF